VLTGKRVKRFHGGEDGAANFFKLKGAGTVYENSTWLWHFLKNPTIRLRRNILYKYPLKK